MRTIKLLLLLCATSILASACGSQPKKLQDLGVVVEAPKAPAPTPPQMNPPPSYSFQTRLQTIFDASPSPQTSSPTIIGNATGTPSK